MMWGMATLAEKLRCERRVRSMIAESGMPEPDEIEYGYTCIWVLWNEPKVALRIDIDEAGGEDGEIEAERSWSDHDDNLRPAS